MIILARWLGAFDFGILRLCLGVDHHARPWPLPLGFNSSILRFLPDYLARAKFSRVHGFLRQSSVITLVMGLSGAGLGAVLVFVRSAPASRNFTSSRFSSACLCLPLASVLTYLEATSRAFGWMHLAYAPGYIVRPILLVAILGGIVWMGLKPSVTDALWALSAACFVAVP